MERRSPSRKRVDSPSRREEQFTTPPKQARPSRPSRSGTPTRTPGTKMAMQLNVMNLSSDDNTPRKKDDEDMENVQPFANEVPMEDTVSLTAIENYFLKGKNVQQNKKRRRKQKKDKRGEREETQEDEESSDETAEVEGDRKFEECDLNALRTFHEQTRPLHAKEVEELGEKHFDEWTLHMASGFNVLVHGLGSLRPLLHHYAEQMGQSYTVVEVEGFRPDCSSRSVLMTVYDLLHFKFQKRRSLTEFARQLAETITDRDVILVIHNIDDPPFRNESDMEVLSILAASPHFHLVASAQHNNRMFLWNMRSIASFNFIHVHVDTWAPMEAETFAGSSSLLGLSSAESASNHTISSLDVLWQSLNKNARSIFHAIFSLMYGVEVDSDAKSVPFWDLFDLCKVEFWVSSDAALRQQLVEFCDHRLIKMRRGNDGNEKIHAAADRLIIHRFLKAVDNPLVEMQLPGEEDDE